MQFEQQQPKPASREPEHEGMEVDGRKAGHRRGRAANSKLARPRDRPRASCETAAARPAHRLGAPSPPHLAAGSAGMLAPAHPEPLGVHPALSSACLLFSLGWSVPCSRILCGQLGRARVKSGCVAEGGRATRATAGRAATAAVNRTPCTGVAVATVSASTRRRLCTRIERRAEWRMWAPSGRPRSIRSARR